MARSGQKFSPILIVFIIFSAGEDGMVIVPYHFIGEEPRGWKSAIKEFDEKTCIRFVLRAPALARRGEVAVYSSGQGCGARVGRFADDVTQVVLSKEGCWRKGRGGSEGGS